jgi:N,N'-diacetylchitobiose phosphorylase
LSLGSWHRLSNGRYTAALDEAGSGYSALGEIALTRWYSDPIEDRDGFFVYLRDRDSGGHWSARFQPMGRRPERYAVTRGAGSFEIERIDQGIETSFAVRVAPNEDLELRRCTVQNDAPVPRRIEVTSYAEVVLAPQSQDAAHPAFSKLFVETERVPGQRALVARRRPHSAGEKPLWLVHWLALEDLETGAIEHETDRMRFIGRGWSLTHPRALTERTPLSGTVGAVLDAIVSLRITLDLPPGARKTVCFGLGAAPTRETALEWAARYGRLRTIDPLFEPAPERSCARSIAHFSLPAAPDRYRPAAVPPPGGSPISEEKLLFDNGYGGFTPDGREYVIRVTPSRRPPLPWVHIIANERFGFLVSESGAGFTWAGNERSGR